MLIRSTAGRVLAPALVLCLIVASILVAQGDASSDGPKATASASVTKQLKKLKRRLAALQAQVDALSRQPGPPGPPGPAGSAPGCAGNDTSDVMVDVGGVCIDKYEASIWDAPTGGNQIAGSISCDNDGQDCTDIYARSVPGVIPNGSISWFEAQQALANVGKRLPTNAEWQQAVAGTPDTGGADDGLDDCNTDSTGSGVATGSRATCVSNHGVFDMVGNRAEWIADLAPAPSTPCKTWDINDDWMCLWGGSTTAASPAGIVRGGSFNSGTGAGPFAIENFHPAQALTNMGVRGVR